MTVVIEKTGDIFTSTAPAIGHGVNTAGVMGGGIAVQFRDRFPEMYASYQDQCDMHLLVPGGCMSWVDGDRTVYNIASQKHPGADARLEWLQPGVSAAVAHAERMGHGLIALPQIGCGIGGLSWEDVLPLLRGVGESGVVDLELWTYAAVSS